MQSDPLNLQNFVTFVCGLSFSKDLNQGNVGIQYCQFFLGFITGLNFNQKQKNNSIDKAKYFLKQLSFEMKDNQLKIQELQTILEKFINGQMNIDEEISDDLMKFNSSFQKDKNIQLNTPLQQNQGNNVQSDQKNQENYYHQNKTQREQSTQKQMLNYPLQNTPLRRQKVDYFQLEQKDCRSKSNQEKQISFTPTKDQKNLSKGNKIKIFEVQVEELNQHVENLQQNQILQQNQPLQQNQKLKQNQPSEQNQTFQQHLLFKYNQNQQQNQQSEQKQTLQQNQTLEQNQIFQQNQIFEQNQILEQNEIIKQNNKKIYNLIHELHENFQQNQEQKSRIYKKQKNNIQTQQCKICLENLDEDGQFLLNCQHLYHKTCLQDYVANQNQLPITCPECRQEILNQDLRQFCNQQLFDKLEEASFKIFIQQNTQIFQCPTRDCHGLYEIEGANQFCVFCQKTFCTKCKRLQHEGICGEASFIKLAKNLKYCQCKKCLSWVEKISGCEHIKCKCGNEFCYLCSEQWKHGHTCKNQKNNQRQQQQGLLQGQQNINQNYRIQRQNGGILQNMPRLF